VIEYLCPSSLDNALEQLSSEDVECQPLAGGQSLMPMMHLRLANPDVLLDLNKLSELDFINESSSQVVIGAMVRYSSLLKSDIIRHRVPLFLQAVPHIAHGAIRNRGTIGGSVALADPAAEMPALLKALDATIVVVSKNGSRSISADDFFLGVYETALLPNELVHSIRIPAAGVGQKFGFYELARRNGDYALVGVAISAQTVEPFSGLRIVFFSIGDHPLRAVDAEKILNGKKRSDAAALAEAQNALSTLEYYADINASSDMKQRLARVVMQRALEGLTSEQG